MTPGEPRVCPRCRKPQASVHTCLATPAPVASEPRVCRHCRAPMSTLPRKCPALKLNFGSIGAPNVCEPAPAPAVGVKWERDPNDPDTEIARVGVLQLAVADYVLGGKPRVGWEVSDAAVEHLFDDGWADSRDAAKAAALACARRVVREAATALGMRCEGGE